MENGELRAGQVLADYFKRHHVDVVLDCWQGNRANVIAHVKSSGQRPGLVFGAHLDVVPPGQGPWQNPPFEPVQMDARLYGRGTADMKGGLAAAAAAVVEMVERGVDLKGDIIFAATAGEETDSCGVLRFIKNNGAETGPLCGVIIPEPTDFSIVTAHRGMCWLKVTTTGKTAHSSTPQTGINAILKMNALLNRLDGMSLPHEPDALLGEPSMSVNQIHGGNAPNVVPDHCTVNVDIRTVPGQGQEQITDTFRAVFAELQNDDPDFRADISVVRSVQALRVDPDCDFVRAVRGAVGIDKTVAVGYTTDGPHFAQMGAPIVIFGPGKPHLCHKPDEYIDLDDVEKARQSFKEIIETLLV